MPRITKKEAEIGLRAYRIWEAEGRPHGKDFEHWLRAEAELSAAKGGKGKASSNPKPARKRAAAKSTPKA
jgi:hypothetical protein